MRVRDFVETIIIVGVFVVAVSSFFFLLPAESITLNYFVGYMSSLSTIIMVLIYILTTSKQLNTMREQLKEMESTRNLQTQPLPFIRPSEKSHLESPNAFHNPELGFHMVFDSRSYFHFKVENIGTGPAVAVDVIPKLGCVGPKGKTMAFSYVSERIESLKQGEISEEMDVHIHDEHTYCLLESLLSPKPFPCTMKTLMDEKTLPCPIADITILYRNILGACFESNTKYELRVYDEDMERLKSWLKSLKKAPIEYSEKMKEHNFLRDQNQMEAAERILREIRSDFAKEMDSRDIALVVNPVLGSFSVKTISDSEYQRRISEVVYPTVLGVSKEQE